MKNTQKFIAPVISILIAQGAGFVGSIFTFSSLESWYLTLNVPAWNPPSWVFGPVWTMLYTLIGTSAYLIWKSKKTPERKRSLNIYGIHLILNALWSILFFGLQNPRLAFIEIIVLLAFIITLVTLFWRIDKRAGLLLLPYLAWVSFATFLNYSIWQLN